jgi:hypothetical protein
MLTIPADYWRELLEQFYDGLSKLDTTNYQVDGSDRWTQSRALGSTAGGATRHLEARMRFEGVPTFGAGHVVQRASLTFVSRYTLDDDSRSQGRAQAALRDAMEYAHRFNYDRARCQVVGASDPIFGSEWIVYQINLTFTYNRG